jgi:hypothetical protein
MESLSLDKIWKIKLDPENRGLRDAWFTDSKQLEQDSVDITVPCCWEEHFQDYEGVAWYYTTIDINTEHEGQISRLCFQASNYRTQVWINGESTGEHDGGYTPFHFEIQDLLRYGSENSIIVRVVSPIVTKDLKVDDLGPNEMPHWRGGLTAGIWQSVSLEFNPHAWIESAFYQPSIEQSQFDLALSVQTKAAIAGEIEIDIFNETGQCVHTQNSAQRFESGANHCSLTLPIENPILWSPENPHLYTAEVRLCIDGRPCALHRERVGLRSFTYENERFCLNGERIYLRGGFWEGVYAKHQSYPEDRAVVRKEIELAKAAGLNLLRPWRRPVPPMILEEADAAGLLVIASPAVECMSCWPALTPETPKRIEHEIRQLVLRDRNHPCIIWWEMFNEVTRKEIAALIAPMSLMTRELDPTRLVLDESGGWADGAHFYLPNSTERKSLAELHSYVRAPVSEKHWKLYQTLGNQDTVEGNTKIKAGAGLFVSEFGFGGLPELETNCEEFQAKGNALLPAYRHHHKILNDLRAALTACELESVYENVDHFCRESQSVQARGNQRQLEALLANENVSGYCIHAFTDGDWILGAGLIDNWQRPKAAYHAIARANANPRILCFPERRNLFLGESVSCNFVLRGENAALPSSIALANKETRHELPVPAWGNAPNFRELSAEIPAKLLHIGHNSIQVAASNQSGAVLYEAEIELYILPEIEVAQSASLVIYDPKNEITPTLESKAYAYTRLSDWTPDETPIVLLFVPEDVSSEAHLDAVAQALTHIEAGKGSAIFLEPPAERNSRAMLNEYDACNCIPTKESLLLKSSTFPFKLLTRPSFSFWESSMHVAKAHPIFEGLPQNCMMDEPYHEVAPVESFYQLDADAAPAQTITWFRPEDKDKVHKRTYLGGEDLWHGTDLAIKAHGKGTMLLSTLILRNKVGKDPVATQLLCNYIQYAESLIPNKIHMAEQVVSSSSTHNP